MRRGLGVLVSLNTSMQRYGRRLVLLCLAPAYRQIAERGRNRRLFATCESEEELKGAFIPEASTTRKNNS